MYIGISDDMRTSFRTLSATISGMMSKGTTIFSSFLFLDTLLHSFPFNWLSLNQIECIASCVFCVVRSFDTLFTSKQANPTFSHSLFLFCRLPLSKDQKLCFSMSLCLLKIKIYSKTPPKTQTHNKQTEIGGIYKETVYHSVFLWCYGS